MIAQPGLRKKVIGIDPGFSGAIAVVEIGDHRPPFVEVHDMPVFAVTTTKGAGSHRIDLHKLHAILGEYSPMKFRPLGGLMADGHAHLIAYIEDVTASPQMGVTSAFNFGFGAGAVQALVAANNIPFKRTSPSKWKRDMRLNADKGKSRMLASEKLPEYAHLWARAKDDGRAEAVLLALWGITYA